MADRIQNFQNAPIGKAPEQTGELSPADLEVLKPKIEGALPAAVAPQPAKEHLQSVGLATKSPDALRLVQPGEWRSHTWAQVQLRKIFPRFKQSVSAPEAFVKKEQAMGPVLRKYQEMLQQIGGELGNAQKA